MLLEVKEPTSECETHQSTPTSLRCSPPTPKKKVYTHVHFFFFFFRQCLFRTFLNFPCLWSDIFETFF